MKYNLEAKKSLGQNFLKNKTIIEKIVLESEKYINKNTNILEIGPGTGELTEEIIKKYNKNKVFCIEADDRAIPILEERFSKNIDKNLEIVHKDIREYDVNKSKIKDYIIIANIPYYLTGFIIRQFLESKNQPKAMILMVQKEIGDRAKDKKKSLFSLGIDTYAESYIHLKVSKGNFVPAPKVDSVVLIIKNINKNIFNKKPKGFEEKYWEIAKKAFNSKRKQLGSTLKITDIKYKTKRPEDLKPEDWIYITELLYNNTNE